MPWQISASCLQLPSAKTTSSCSNTLSARRFADQPDFFTLLVFHGKAVLTTLPLDSGPAPFNHVPTPPGGLIVGKHRGTTTQPLGLRTSTGFAPSG